MIFTCGIIKPSTVVLLTNLTSKHFDEKLYHTFLQAVFYMFVFRQDEFKESKVALERLHKLGLQRIGNKNIYDFLLI